MYDRSPDEPLFTVACDSDGTTLLLFYRPEWREEDLRSLAKESFIPRIVGDPFVTYRDPGISHVVVSPLVAPRFIASLKTFDLNTEYVVYNASGEMEIIRPMDVYNKCGYPLKYAIGCDECLLNREKYNPQCTYIQREEEGQNGGLSPEDVTEEFASRKSKIGEYTYIGPTLTSSDHIVMAIRGVEDHDFSFVTMNTKIRKEAQQERYRYLKFKKEVCTQCFVKDACWSEAYGKEEYAIRGCTGNYEGTEHQTAQEIVRNVKVPFTNKEILYLLANSGELEKRYNKRIYYATFRISRTNHGARSVLGYHLVRVTNPCESIEIETFKEAKKILEEYTTTRSPYTDKLSTIAKATLIEFAGHTESPVRRGGWRCTSYPTLGITCTWGGDSFVQHYRRGSTTAPWPTTVNDLSDVYTNYGALRFAGKTKSPLGRYFKY